MMLLLRDLLDRNAALYGAAPAVIFRGTPTSWAQLRERVFRLANHLRAEGIRRGDRVGVVQGNGPEVGEIAFAAALLGAVTVPISPRLTEAEASWIYEDAEIALGFVGADRTLPAAERVIETQGPEYERFVAGGDPGEPASEEQPGDVVLQIYTSGTTGRPKGAMLTQSAMLWNGLSTVHAQGVRHGDVFLTATPITHAAAATRVFTLAIDGLTNVILERFDPAEFLAAIGRHGVTTTIIVPAILRALLDEPALASSDLRTLKSLIYGAAPSPRPLIDEALERMPCKLEHAYGLTEGCPALTVLSDEEHRRGIRDTIGRPVAGVAMKVGSVEATAATGEAGELLVRSPKNMVGYWKQPEATAAALRGGWLHTGDVAYRDAGGYLFLVDRMKDMLISGGFNVYPSEIERVLHATTGVREAAVIGVEDARWGEAPVAFVVGEADEAALRASCETELARYKHPKAFVFLDALPRNENGKVLKRALRELVAR